MGLVAGARRAGLGPMGRKRLSVTTKARIFDTRFNVKGTGAEGYANPNRPHTAKTASINAKEKKAALDSRIAGDTVSRDSVTTSMRNKGAKKRIRYKAGSGGIGG